MALVRQPGFAGSFYLDDPYALRQQVESFLKAADLFKRLSIPKAIISPHAGYVYSGPVAASGFACLQGENSIKRVVVIAPSHQYPFYGIALTKADYYKTPLGEILIDKAAQEILLTQGQDVGFAEAAFDQEHSLEVQLPFLQVTLGDFKLVPVIVGQTDIKNVANLIELLWDENNETLFVISSDLSHYLDNTSAKILDKKTAQAIESLDEEAIGFDQACGRLPILGLLRVARKKRLKFKCLDLRNSADTQGPSNHVVGYGSFHLLSHPGKGE